jgi:hypothetical protein
MRPRWLLASVSVAFSMVTVVACGAPLPNGTGHTGGDEPTPTPSPLYRAAESLDLGDCFDPIADADTGALLAANIRRCEDPHLMEVFGLPTIDVPLGEPFPPLTEIDAESERLYRTEFRRYVGIDFDESRLAATSYQPTEQTWAVGDRVVICVVEAAPISPLTQSVRDSRQ